MSEFKSMSYSQALRKYPTNYKLRAMGRKKFDSMYNQTEQKNNKTVTKLKSNKLQMAPKGRLFLVANNPKGGTAEDFKSKRKIETDNKKSTSDKKKDNVKKSKDKPKIVAKPTVEKKDFDKLSFNEKIDALNRSKSEKDQARAQKMKEQMKKIKARLKARRDLKNKKKQSSGAKARKERR